MAPQPPHQMPRSPLVRLRLPLRLLHLAPASLVLRQASVGGPQPGLHPGVPPPDLSPGGPPRGLSGGPPPGAGLAGPPRADFGAASLRADPFGPATNRGSGNPPGFAQRGGLRPRSSGWFCTRCLWPLHNQHLRPLWKLRTDTLPTDVMATAGPDIATAAPQPTPTAPLQAMATVPVAPTALTVVTTPTGTAIGNRPTRASQFATRRPLKVPGRLDRMNVREYQQCRRPGRQDEDSPVNYPFSKVRVDVASVATSLAWRSFSLPLSPKRRRPNDLGSGRTSRQVASTLVP